MQNVVDSIEQIERVRSRLVPGRRAPIMTVMAIVTVAVFAALFAAAGNSSGGSIASADAGGCKVVDSPWSADSDGVAHLTGTLKGTGVSHDFIPDFGSSVLPVLQFTALATYTLNGGEMYGSITGTVNIETGEVDFVTTVEGGTHRWAGSSGEIHVLGVDGIGGTSEGFVCVGKSEWDNGRRQNS